MINNKDTHQLAYHFEKKCFYTSATADVTTFETLLKRLEVIDLSDRPKPARVPDDQQKTFH